MFVCLSVLVPLTADTWPLLNRLHAEPLTFSHPHSCAALLILVDGSCYWPNHRLSSVAASAAVIADVCKGKGVVHSSVLPGCEQSSDRAEIYAILLALQLSKSCTVSSDCQYAVNAQGFPSAAHEHMDLWEVFDALMAGRPEGLGRLSRSKHTWI